MFKIIIFIFFNIVYCQSIFSNFISHHLTFLSRPIKNITFDYRSQNIDGESTAGSGTIIINQNNYKIIFDEHIFLFTNSIFKRYNKSTNQIFIENSNSTIDSLFSNFFSTDYLNGIELDSTGRILSLPILSESSELDTYIYFSSDSSMITSINLTYDSFNFELFNIIFSNLEHKNLFNIDAPDAFILDLRD